MHDHNEPPRAARLRRRTVLSGGAAGLAAAALTVWTSPARAATAEYFVDSAAGDDTADGSRTRPWATTARVNQAIASGAAAAGSTVRFRRGRRFHGIIRPGSTRGLRFESWGDESEAPVITTYKYVQGERCWDAVGDGLWQVDLSAANIGRTHHGHVSTWTTEIGFLKVDGTMHGDRKASTSALTEDWQFTSIGPVVTVRCTENPSTDGRRVWLAVAEPILEGRSGTTVRDLALLGTGRNAVQTASSAVPTQGFTLAGCIVGEAGGGFAADGVSRMGNGVQVWSGATDVLIAANTIVDCWDTAMTIQGPAVVSGPSWSNVEFNGNVSDRNMQTFEYWSSGAPDPGTVSTCAVRGTRASRAGSSWSARVRLDRSGKGSHVLFYSDAVEARIAMRGNEFAGASDAYLYAKVRVPVGLTSDENTIRLAPTTRLHWQRSERIDQRAAWTAATGLEQNSTFAVLA